jgi:hypothetical protein
VATGPDGDVDDVWMIVERDLADYAILSEASEYVTAEDGSRMLIDEVTEVGRYVEFFAQGFEQNQDIQSAVYLDSSLEFDNTINETLLPGFDSITRGATNVPFEVTSFFELLTEDGLDFLVTEAEDFLAVTDDIFAATDVGREIRLRYFDSASEQWLTARALITSYVDESKVLCTILAPFPNSDEIPANGWRMTSTVITGLWHLEGQTISALADGAEIENLTVLNGSVTMPVATARAQFGLPYTSYLATQRIDSGATDGTAQGKTKRFHQIVMRLYASLGGKVGPDASSTDYILYRSLSDYMDEVPPVLTGDTDKFPYPGGYETDGRIWVLADQPLPLTVVAMYPRMKTED